MLCMYFVLIDHKRLYFQTNVACSLLEPQQGTSVTLKSVFPTAELHAGNSLPPPFHVCVDQSTNLFANI